jgi:hypothetical protein
MLYALPALLLAPPVPTLLPGLVQYTEGSSLASSNSGNTVGQPHLVAGSELVTRGDGRAEVLLTPGVVLWVGPNSRMVVSSISADACSVELTSGDALLQVLHNSASGTVTVKTSGSTLSFAKPGLFRLSGSKPRAVLPVKDELWRWARQRDELLAQANLDAAKSVRDHHETIASPIWAWDGSARLFTYLPLRSQQTSSFGAVYWSPEYVHNAFRPSMAGAGGGIISRPGAAAPSSTVLGMTPPPKPPPTPPKQ